MSTAPLVRVVARDRSGPGRRLRLHRLAFGVPIAEDAVPNRDGTSDRIYHFAPGSVFAMVWSRRTCLGRMRRILAVVEAPRLPGDERRPLPGVRPGVIVHATLSEFGPAGSVGTSGDVDRMLDLIDRVRAAGLEPAPRAGPVLGRGGRADPVRPAAAGPAPPQAHGPPEAGVNHHRSSYGYRAWVKATAARHPALAFGAAVTAALAIASVLLADRQVVLNTSPSVPPGLYLLSSATPAVGRLVDFPVPPAARPYVLARSGRDGRDWYILKPVVAGPGDRVDTTGAWLTVNGRPLAPMPPAADASGRPLPVWRARRFLRPGEFLVVSTRIANSFDSRCYGPVTAGQIAAVRVPLVTW